MLCRRDTHFTAEFRGAMPLMVHNAMFTPVTAAILGKPMSPQAGRFRVVETHRKKYITESRVRMEIKLPPSSRSPSGMRWPSLSL